MNRIFLRAFEPDDYKLTYKWRQDEEITKFLSGNKWFVSSERERRWVEEKILDDRANIYLAICENETGLMLGYLSINNIDLRNRTAEWGGLTIGSKEHQNKGYASEAAKMMLEYIFEELGINRCYVYCLAKHPYTIKLFEKLGFTKEGELRECIFKNNEFNNLLLYSMLRAEYLDMKSVTV